MEIMDGLASPSWPVDLFRPQSWESPTSNGIDPLEKQRHLVTTGRSTRGRTVSCWSMLVFAKVIVNTVLLICLDPATWKKHKESRDSSAQMCISNRFGRKLLTSYYRWMNSGYSVELGSLWRYLQFLRFVWGAKGTPISTRWTTVWCCYFVLHDSLTTMVLWFGVTANKHVTWKYTIKLLINRTIVVKDGQGNLRNLHIKLQGVSWDEIALGHPARSCSTGHASGQSSQQEWLQRKCFVCKCRIW